MKSTITILKSTALKHRIFCIASYSNIKRLPCVKGTVKILILTEGLFYGQIYILTNTFKISFNFVVWYSNYLKSILLKKFCAFAVFYFMYLTKFHSNRLYSISTILNLCVFQLLRLNSNRQYKY